MVVAQFEKFVIPEAQFYRARNLLWSGQQQIPHRQRTPVRNDKINSVQTEHCLAPNIVSPDASHREIIRPSPWASAHNDAVRSLESRSERSANEDNSRCSCLCAVRGIGSGTEGSGADAAVLLQAVFVLWRRL